jgi:hypothetical protein
MKDFFFKPYQGESSVSIKALSEAFDSNGIDDQKSLLLARFLVETNEGVLDLERTAKQREIVEKLKKLIGSYILYQDQVVVKQY